VRGNKTTSVSLNHEAAAEAAFIRYLPFKTFFNIYFLTCPWWSMAIVIILRRMESIIPLTKKLPSTYTLSLSRRGSQNTNWMIRESV